jgi:hypothetical protein
MPDDSGDGRDGAITGRMPAGIVDGLQVVEVDEHDPNGAKHGGRRRAEQRHEVLEEVAPQRQPRRLIQRIFLLAPAPDDLDRLERAVVFIGERSELVAEGRSPFRWKLSGPALDHQVQAAANGDLVGFGDFSRRTDMLRRSSCMAHAAAGAPA